MSAAPQLRGLLASATKKHTAIGIVFITSTTLAVKFLGRDKRVKQHEEYYKYVMNMRISLCRL